MGLLNRVIGGISPSFGASQKFGTKLYRDDNGRIQSVRDKDGIDTAKDEPLWSEYIKRDNQKKSKVDGENPANAYLTTGGYGTGGNINDPIYDPTSWGSSWVTHSVYDGKYATIGFVSGVDCVFVMDEDEYRSFYNAGSKGKWLWGNGYGKNTHRYI